MRSTIILTALLCLLFQACKKEDELPDAHGTRLKKMIITTGSEVTSRLFMYDDQERLVEIYDSSKLTEYSYTKFDYNSQGKMIRATIGNSNTGDAMKFYYYYNRKGQLILRTLISFIPYSNYVIREYSHLYGYDTTGKMVGDTMISPDSHDVISYATYQYDKNENVVQWVWFQNENGTFTKTNEEKHTYDNKPNAYSNVSQTMYFISDYASMYLSKNNQRGAKDSYEYYSNGLPRKLTTISTQPYTDKAVYEFFYK